MACRVLTGRLDDQSCTDRPASGAAVGLTTIPETVTLPLGFAIVGVIEVIAIHGSARAVSPLAAAAAGLAGAAAAGTAVSHPAPAAEARTYPRATSRRPPRPRCCR